MTVTTIIAASIVTSEAVLKDTCLLLLLHLIATNKHPFLVASCHSIEFFLHSVMDCESSLTHV